MQDFSCRRKVPMRVAAGTPGRFGAKVRQAEGVVEPAVIVPIRSIATGNS